MDKQLIIVNKFKDLVYYFMSYILIARYFTYVDHDWLSGYGEVHPDWLYR